MAMTAELKTAKFTPHPVGSFGDQLMTDPPLWWIPVDFEPGSLEL